MRSIKQLVHAIMCVLIVVVGIYQNPVHAQTDEPITLIENAYRDLSSRLGVTVIRNGTSLRPTRHTWTIKTFADSSLECPAAGANYVVGDVTGYQIVLTYRNTTYDYRATADGSVLFLCTPTSRAPGNPVVVPSSFPPVAPIAVNPVDNTTPPLSTINNAATPLLLTFEGDQWSWSEAENQLKQLTEWRFNDAAILSPDGKTIAYRSRAKFVVDTLSSGSIHPGEGDLPSTIWLLDVATGEPWRIADQPANPSFFGEGPANYVLRSTPTWSPDDKAVAWAEFVVVGQAQTNQLVIYSMGDRTTKIIRLSPKLQYVAGGGYAPQSVYWGQPGIAVRVVTQNAQVGLAAELSLYSSSGQLLFGGRLPNPESDLLWVRDADHDILTTFAVTSNTAQQPGLNWAVFDFGTGAVSPLNGIPELYSLTAPTGMSLYPTTNQQSSTVWNIASQQANIGIIPIPIYSYGFVRQLAISADGMEIAYISGQNVIVSNGKSTRTITSGNGSSSISVVWGPVAWRLRRR